MRDSKNFANSYSGEPITEMTGRAELPGLCIMISPLSFAGIEPDGKSFLTVSSPKGFKYLRMSCLIDCSLDITG